METGRCPRCNIAMTYTKTIYWQHKTLNFPYRIYHCQYHGAFVWRRRKGYELVDFSKSQRHATVTPSLPNVQWTDYTIVKYKCPYCEEEWTQHKEFHQSEKVRCPNGHLIPKNDVMKEE